MAETNTEAMATLMADVTFSNGAINDMLSVLVNGENLVMPDFEPILDDPPRLDEKKPILCPECGHEFTT